MYPKIDEQMVNIDMGNEQKLEIRVNAIYRKWKDCCNAKKQRKKNAPNHSGS